MTKISYKWTKPGFTPIIFRTWTDAKEMVKRNGGSFETIYTKGKDVDYYPPNPNRKSYANRLVAI